MYDPTIGQFLSEDPITFAALDWNLRRYVGNSPTNFTDPTGLEAEDDTPDEPDIYDLEKPREEASAEAKELEKLLVPPHIEKLKAAAKESGEAERGGQL